MGNGIPIQLTVRDVGMWLSGASIATALSLGEHAFDISGTIAALLP
ncbi:hypothetical protein ACFQE8_10385 [Salinirubellus sp. GCM10025818]|jgi:hypothetical protein